MPLQQEGSVSQIKHRLLSDATTTPSSITAMHIWAGDVLSQHGVTLGAREFNQEKEQHINTVPTQAKGCGKKKEDRLQTGWQDLKELLYELTVCSDEHR